MINAPRRAGISSSRHIHSHFCECGKRATEKRIAAHFFISAGEVFQSRVKAKIGSRQGTGKRTKNGYWTQLFFAPSRIHARMELRSHVDSFFFPCGIRSSGDARQSSNNIKLLLSGSRGITMGPNLVPFITPS